MNNQLRVISVLIGAVLVLLTFSFPQWQPYLAMLPGRSETAVLGLTGDLAEQVTLLPPEQTSALLTLAEEDPDMARQLAIAQLSQGIVVDDEVPQESGQRRAIQGDFVPAADVVQVEGTLTIYELADSSHILRIDDLNVTNAPTLQLYLSVNGAPINREEMEQNGDFIELQPLQGSAGNHNYRISPEVDVQRYNSVVIYSEELQFVVGYARFTGRF